MALGFLAKWNRPGYPVAMTRDAKPDAPQYLAFLTTPEAKAVFERYGFRVLAKPTH
jgi:molybdate transport system substrate-binding protein